MDTWPCLLLLIGLSFQQATEPYNNEESASRDEVGTLAAADHVDGDNVDSVSDDEEIWTRAFSADQDTDQQIKNGNKVNATQMRVMTSEKIMEELDQHSVPTTLVEEGDEMNINNKKSADSMSKTETSKDSIVEVESLRTQVAILAGLGGVLLLLLFVAVLVLGAIVLRISRELGGKWPLDERKRGELGGGGVNMGGGGVNMGAGAEMGGRGSKYETAEGCTNGGFSDMNGGSEDRSRAFPQFNNRPNPETHVAVDENNPGIDLSVEKYLRGADERYFREEEEEAFSSGSFSLEGDQGSHDGQHPTLKPHFS